MWRNPTSGAHQSYAAEAWATAEDDQGAGNIMVENSHRAEHARMDEMIIKRWDTNWRQAVNDYKPPVAAAGADRQRTLTQILSEDYPIPVAAHTMSNGFFEDDDLSARYMIDDWDKAWAKADEEEYKASAEYTRDQQRQRKEDAKKAKEEQKRKRAEAEDEAERVRRAAMPSQAEKNQIIRNRLKERARAALDQRPAAPPVAPPVAQPVAPPVAQPSTVTRAEADAMVAANPNLSIEESISYRGHFYVNDTQTSYRPWIVGSK